MSFLYIKQILSIYHSESTFYGSYKLIYLIISYSIIVSAPKWIPSCYITFYVGIHSRILRKCGYDVFSWRRNIMLTWNEYKCLVHTDKVLLVVAYMPTLL